MTGEGFDCLLQQLQHCKAEFHSVFLPEVAARKAAAAAEVSRTCAALVHSNGLRPLQLLRCYILSILYPQQFICRCRRLQPLLALCFSKRKALADSEVVQREAAAAMRALAAA
jgi:hypothetical protein